MKRLLLFVFGILLVLLLSGDSRHVTATGGEHTTMAGLPHNIYLMRVHPGDMAYYRYTFNQAIIQKLYALNGPNIWIGYKNGGWGVGSNTIWESYIELYGYGRTDGPYYLWIASSPAEKTLKYLFLYNSLVSWCDGKQQTGQHCGQHDWVYDTSSGGKVSTTFAAPASDILDIYKSVGYFSLGQ